MKQKILRPLSRRPSIPQGLVFKAKQEKRGKEKEKSWQKEWKQDLAE